MYSTQFTSPTIKQKNRVHNLPPDSAAGPRSKSHSQKRHQNHPTKPSQFYFSINILQHKHLILELTNNETKENIPYSRIRCV